jgi:4-amino-4-deoxy-L-arabinose transferase-like glycosyltransferase
LTVRNLSRVAVWSCLATYVGLFVFNMVTRIGRFSPDSMNYVNVARNIAEGNGITQPTLGFNQRRINPDDDIPAPLIAHPPLYPLLISWVTRIGVSAPVSALLVSASGLALIFVLVFKLAAALYGEKVALTSMGLSLFYGPLRYIAGFAWSDPVAIALMLFCLLLLVRKSAAGRFVFTAGFVAGLAFATRYAFLPLLPVGAAFLIISSPSARRIRNVCLYGFAFALVAGSVWGHNFVATGSLMPPSRRAPADLSETMVTAFRSIFGRYMIGLSPRLQFSLFAVSLLVCAISLFKGGIVRRTREVFVANNRYLLVAWSLTYLIFIVAQRSAWFFGEDRANEMLRIAAPAGIVLLICWTSLLINSLQVPLSGITIIVLLLLSVSIWREGRAMTQVPRFDLQQQVRYFPRLAWIAAHTSNADLIIGEDTVDIPFFLSGRRTLSFSPYPITEYATYDLIESYSRRHCAAYQNIFIILPNHGLSEEQWRAVYGNFFADLIFGEIEKYPAITLVQQLEDASVFKVQCR